MSARVVASRFRILRCHGLHGLMALFSNKIFQTSLGDVPCVESGRYAGVGVRVESPCWVGDRPGGVASTVGVRQMTFWVTTSSGRTLSLT